MNLIREYVRLILSEAAITIGQARNLALFVGNDVPKIYMLYDSQDLIKRLHLHVSSYDDLMSSVLGVMGVSSYKNAWNATQVKFVATESGYGPLLYDIVMKLENGLMPDREGVSDDAKKIWSFYKERRSDVEAKPLDDISNPMTPPKEDDAKVYKRKKDYHEDPLNYAYFLRSNLDVSGLIHNHEIVKNELQSLGCDKKELIRIAEVYFELSYGAG